MTAVVFNYLRDEQVKAAIQDPEWPKGLARNPNDWRKYIPAPLRDEWPNLGIEAQVVAFWMATEQADAEEWD